MLFLIHLPLLVVQPPSNFIEVTTIRFVTENTSSLEIIDLQEVIDITLLPTASHILGNMG
jgi:hypothetical protein